MHIDERIFRRLTPFWQAGIEEQNAEAQAVAHACIEAGKVTLEQFQQDGAWYYRLRLCGLTIVETDLRNGGVFWDRPEGEMVYLADPILDDDLKPGTLIVLVEHEAVG